MQLARLNTNPYITFKPSEHKVSTIRVHLLHQLIIASLVN